MKKIRTISLLLIFSLALSLLSGCQSHVNAPAEDAGEEHDGAGSGYLVDTLKLAGGTDWGMPSPYLNVSRGPGQAKMRLVFASLLEKDETGDVPWLAESWSFEGNEYTFTLFRGQRFHDGEPLTTEHY